MSENRVERELDWNDAIEHDGADFVVLPAGDYDFLVEAVERGQHNGSDKLPPCKKAMLSIRLAGPEGSTVIKHNLFLHTRVEGLLCAFFRSIGQRKHGEKLAMDWSKVPYARGRCQVGVREYVKKDGAKATINEIKKFYDAADAPVAQPAGAGQAAFTPGTF